MANTIFYSAFTLGMAIIIAAYLIGSRSEGHFVAYPVGYSIVRLDTSTGEMISCASECRFLAKARIVFH